MIFVFKKWDEFCQKLCEKDIISIPAVEVSSNTKGYLVLKHDVETDVPKAHELAKIEQKYGHRGTYYVQAYLLDSVSNVEMLKDMQNMGHEISYHYDVMDSCKGDIDKAITEFDTNKNKFEGNGFVLKTLCQHGNPVVERVGYTSNRDFFRNDRVRATYPILSDIMVNFKEMYKTEYVYFSDAGRKFKMIYDPLYNDVVNSDDKNIAYDNLDVVFNEIVKGGNFIISTHPHRWTSSATLYAIKTVIFKIVKSIAKLLIKIPLMKRFMSRFYYLAKKI